MAFAESSVPQGITAARWIVKAAGSFAIIDGRDLRDVTPRGRKARAIVAYLASRPSARVSRESIAELLWGDRGEAQARASLRQALFEIRHAAPGPPDLILGDRHHVWINDEQVQLIEANLGAIGDCESVPFQDLDHITHEYDEWLHLERSRRARQLMDELRLQAEEKLSAGDAEEAMTLIDAMERIDPYDEEALRLAMRAEFRLGHSAGVEKRYQAACVRLMEELGVQPSADTQALHAELLKQIGTDPADRVAHLATPRAKPMDAETSRPKGREREQARTAMRSGLVAMVLIALVVITLGSIWMWRSAGGAAASQPAKLAVLPFRASGVDPVLAEGLSEGLISRLARDGQFRVTGQTSAWQYKDRAVDLRQIGRALGVDYVVEGSVRQAGQDVRVTAALVRTEDRATLWRREFVGQHPQPALEYAVQSGITESLGFQTPPFAGPARRSAAYPLFLRSRALVRQRTQSSMTQAKALLREAIRVDPEHAPSWSLLGLVWTLSAGKNLTADGELYRKNMALGRAMIERAMRLDPKLAQAHAAMAINVGLEDDRARQHLAMALKLNPNDPQALYWWGSTQRAIGNLDAGNRANQRALELDPLWRRPVVVAAEVAVLNGNSRAADKLLASMRKFAPEAATEVEMAIAMKKGEYARSIQIGMHELSRLSDDFSGRAMLTDALITLGYVDEAALIGGFSPPFRSLISGTPADLQSIVRESRRLEGNPYGYIYHAQAVAALSQAGRHEDVAQLYLNGVGPLARLRKPRLGDADIVWSVGPEVALSLLRTGRGAEAKRVLARVDDVARRFGANKLIDPHAEVCFAMADAIRGRRESAIRRLEKAASRGWYAFEAMPPQKLGEYPAFATLREDPRFARLDKTLHEKVIRERAKAAAYL